MRRDAMMEKVKNCVYLILYVMLVIIPALIGLREIKEGWRLLTYGGDVSRAMQLMSFGIGMLCIPVLLVMMIVVTCVSVWLESDWTLLLFRILLVSAIVLLATCFIAIMLF